MGELAIGRRPAVDDWDERMRELVASTVLRPKRRQATYSELALLAEHAERTGLSPLLGQLYGIYRRDTKLGSRSVRQLDGVEVESDEYLTIQTGIDGLRTIAQRTREYESQDAILYANEFAVWSDVWLEEGPPRAAKARVWRRAARRATEAVVLWREYDGGPLARSMPVLMLGKVAEAQALRKAFPADLAGIYIPEEFDRQRAVDGDVPAPEAAGPGEIRLAVNALAIDNARKDRIHELIDDALAVWPSSWTPDKVNLLFAGRSDDDVDQVIAGVEAELEAHRPPVEPIDADVVVEPGPEPERPEILRRELADLESARDELDPLDDRDAQHESELVEQIERLESELARFEP